MGSPTGEFAALPPTQYEAFFDVSESVDMRVWAAILDRTIGNPGEGRERSPFAREKNGNITKQINLAAELEMQESEISEALDRPEKRGRIRRDGGKIWLRADAPAPDRTTRKAKKDRTELHCTVKFNCQNFAFWRNCRKTMQPGSKPQRCTFLR
jgi:hypothetical protein